MRKTKICFCFPFFILCAKKKKIQKYKKRFIHKKIHKMKIYFHFPFFVLCTRIYFWSLVITFCMDKWGVVQSVGQYTIGVWIKYSTSDACVDHIRQPIYNLGTSSIRNNTWPMTGWLSCCSTETSRNRENYFTIIVRTWVGNGVVYVFATL